MRRRLLTLGVAAAVATALTGAGAATAASPAQTLAPGVTGWWSAANRTSAVPAIAPPDVAGKDLYVAGGNAVVSQLGQSVGAPAAIAALRFRLPDGATAKQLRLRLAGTHPPAVTITACRALESFTAAYDGAWDKAPAYDCTTSGTARLTSDGQVVIDDVDELRDGNDLAVVLVPGPLDRLVIAAPDARTLAVTAPVTPLGSDAAPPPAGPDTGSGGASGGVPGGAAPQETRRAPGGPAGSCPATVGHRACRRVARAVSGGAGTDRGDPRRTALAGAAADAALRAARVRRAAAPVGSRGERRPPRGARRRAVPQRAVGGRGRPRLIGPRG